MNLVADECVPRPVIEQLRADGHTVTWIGDSHPGIGDADVLAFALQAGAPLLTIDTDFGELVFRENRPSVALSCCDWRACRTSLSQRSWRAPCGTTAPSSPGSSQSSVPAGFERDRPMARVSALRRVEAIQPGKRNKKYRLAR